MFLGDSRDTGTKGTLSPFVRDVLPESHRDTRRSPGALGLESSKAYGDPFFLHRDCRTILGDMDLGVDRHVGSFRGEP